MFLKNRNISSKIKRSKVTDYAALTYSLILYRRIISIRVRHLFICKVCVLKQLNLRLFTVHLMQGPRKFCQVCARVCVCVCGGGGGAGPKL